MSNSYSSAGVDNNKPPLRSLPDVKLSNLQDNQVLAFKQASQKWENVTVSGGGGGGVDTLAELLDVDVNAAGGLEPGNCLSYDPGIQKWVPVSYVNSFDFPVGLPSNVPDEIYTMTVTGSDGGTKAWRRAPWLADIGANAIAGQFLRYNGAAWGPAYQNAPEEDLFHSVSIRNTYDTAVYKTSTIAGSVPAGGGQFVFYDSTGDQTDAIDLDSGSLQINTHDVNELQFHKLTTITDKTILRFRIQGLGGGLLKPDSYFDIYVITPPTLVGNAFLFPAGTLEAPPDGFNFTPLLNQAYYTLQIDADPAAVAPKNNYNAAVDPLPTDDAATGGYSAGSQWYNVLTNRWFTCYNAFTAQAIWRSAGVLTRETQIEIGTENTLTNFTSTNRSVCMGRGNALENATAADLVVYGLDNNPVGGNSSICIGSGNSTTGNSAVVVGTACLGNGNCCVALGTNCFSTEAGSVAIGQQAQAQTTNGIAIGQSASVQAGSANSTAVGSNATGAGENFTALGYFANAAANDAISIGQSSYCGSAQGISIGTEADCREGNLSLCQLNKANAIGTLCIGKSSVCAIGSNNSILLGNGSETDKASSIVIGNGVVQTNLGSNSVSIGNGSGALVNAVAIGSAARAAAAQIAIGDSASSELGGIALGQNAITTALRRLALTAGITLDATGTNNYDFVPALIGNLPADIVCRRAGYPLVAANAETRLVQTSLTLGDRLIYSGSGGVWNNSTAVFGGLSVFQPTPVTTIALTQNVYSLIAQTLPVSGTITPSSGGTFTQAPSNAQLTAAGITGTHTVQIEWSVTGCTITNNRQVIFKIEHNGAQVGSLLYASTGNAGVYDTFVGNGYVLAGYTSGSVLRIQVTNATNNDDFDYIGSRIVVCSIKRTA